MYISFTLYITTVHNWIKIFLRIHTKFPPQKPFPLSLNSLYLIYKIAPRQNIHINCQKWKEEHLTFTHRHKKKPAKNVYRTPRSLFCGFTCKKFFFFHHTLKNTHQKNSFFLFSYSVTNCGWCWYYTE